MPPLVELRCFDALCLHIKSDVAECAPRTQPSAAPKYNVMMPHDADVTMRGDWQIFLPRRHRIDITTLFIAARFRYTAIPASFAKHAAHECDVRHQAGQDDDSEAIRHALRATAGAFMILCSRASQSATAAARKYRRWRCHLAEEHFCQAQRRADIAAIYDRCDCCYGDTDADAAPIFQPARAIFRPVDAF